MAAADDVDVDAYSIPFIIIVFHLRSVAEWAERLDEPLATPTNHSRRRKPSCITNTYTSMILVVVDYDGKRIVYFMSGYVLLSYCRSAYATISIIFDSSEHYSIIFVRTH